MECVRITTTKHSSASSRSVSNVLRVLQSRTISSRKRETSLALKSIIMLTILQNKSLTSRKKAWILSALKTSCFANFRRLRFRNVQHSSV